MSDFKFELGCKAKSVINGFEGIVTSRADHLNGCNRYWLAPPAAKDGSYIDGCWFDEQELEVVAKPAAKIKKMSDYYNEDLQDPSGGFPSRMK